MNYITLNYSDLAISAGLMAALILLSIFEKLKLEKDILIATIRAFIQLTIAGYLLNSVFEINKWYLVLAVMLFMLSFASYNGRKRIKYEFKGSFRIFLISMLAGAGGVMVFTGALVLDLSPWYQPQYLIPIFGMIGSNSMNAISLALNDLSSAISHDKQVIDARLSLGLTPFQSILPYLRNASRTAMIPTINSLMIIGISQLPGMMSGQIIGGVPPMEAVKYQLIIMYMIAAGNGISALIALYQAYKVFFNSRKQLIV